MDENPAQLFMETGKFISTDLGLNGSEQEIVVQDANVSMYTSFIRHFTFFKRTTLNFI